jgi:hypothetical protein
VGVILLASIARYLYKLFFHPYERSRKDINDGGGTFPTRTRAKKKKRESAFFFFLTEQPRMLEAYATFGMKSKRNVPLGIRTKRNGQFPPPFPNGWFKILDSHDIQVGEKKFVSFLGQQWAVFRGFFFFSLPFHFYFRSFFGDHSKRIAMINRSR